MAIRPASERASDPALDQSQGKAGSNASLVDLAILDDDPDFCNYLEDALKDDGLDTIRAFGHIGYDIVAISDASFARYLAHSTYYDCVAPDTRAASA